MNVVCVCLCPWQDECGLCVSVSLTGWMWTVCVCPWQDECGLCVSVLDRMNVDCVCLCPWQDECGLCVCVPDMINVALSCNRYVFIFTWVLLYKLLLLRDVKMGHCFISQISLVTSCRTKQSIHVVNWLIVQCVVYVPSLWGFHVMYTEYICVLRGVSCKLGRTFLMRL